MRLGAYPATLAEGSHIARIYGSTHISERHRHRYEVNMRYRDDLERAGFGSPGCRRTGSCRRRSNIPTTRGSSACSITPN